MKCTRMRLPDGNSAIVCSRGPASKRLNARHSVDCAPALPLQGGGETERARLSRLLACVGREAGKRKTFYPRWVAEGRMAAEAAERETGAWADVGAALTEALRGTLLHYARIDRLVCTVAREIGRREKTYPRQVLRGRMKQATADRELAEMRELLAWLHEQRRSGPR